MKPHQLYEQPKQYLLTQSDTAKGGVILCIVLGIVAFVVSFVQPGMASRFWGAYLLSTFFFFSIALGGVAFGAMQDVIGALWGRPIKRVHEAFGAFLPVAALLFMLFFLVIKLRVGHAYEVYSWIADPSEISHYHSKAWWLRENFMMARDICALIVILLLSRWQFKQTLTRDMLLMEGLTADAQALGKEAKVCLRHWGAPILVSYAICYSLLAFDLLMSLAPTWFSTLWAGWLFSIMMQTLMALLLLVMFVLKNGVLGNIIQRQQFHDVGKMMHGFTIFFAYLTYAHVLTYWYGNVPEETSYFIPRLQQPWLTLILVSPLLGFVIPLFALIPKASKWTSSYTWPIAVTILVAQFLTYVVVVMPQIVEGASWRFPTVELGVFLGMLGIFLSVFYWFGKRYPMVSIADPLLMDALNKGHH